MKAVFIFAFTVLMISSACGYEIETKEKETINSAIDMLYREDFEKALPVFVYIKDTYPDHPIGDFFLGFYYNFLSSFYETDRFDSRIVLYYDLAEKKARFHLQFDGDNPWFNYYLGASMVNRGYMLGRDGNRFAGIRKTYSGIGFIEKALEKDKDLGDALMLLGAYRFYRGSLYSWLFDRRDSAVDLVRESLDKTWFSEFAALSALGWIYIDYGKYKDAEKAADAALEKYPDSHLFLFLKARALFESERYGEAAVYYGRLRGKLISMPESHSEKDLFNTYYFLSRTYRELKNIEESEKYLELALHTALTPKEKNLLSDRIKELEKIRRSKGR